MSNTVTPTASTFTAVEPALYLATASLGTRRTLDLTAKFGATVLVRIGRQVVTALTRSGYVMIRRTNNNTGVIPSTIRDCVSSIAVAGLSTTFSGTASIGDATTAFASVTGWSVGDIVCMHTTGTNGNLEWGRIFAISGTTVTWEEPLKSAHASGELAINGSDMFSVWLPGGDIWEICCANNSGQGLAFQVDAIVYASDTIN